MADSFQPPSEFDDYVILQPLGAGKMGQVYLAEDTVLARHVAVKFIAGVDPDLTARQRFLIEARAAARIQHPNVASIYRVGELGEHPYLITEFVRGKSLADQAKPLPWTRALEIGIDLARGLAAAHRKGVVHCDIKSANVMITDEGAAKLVDFGLATLVQEGPGDESNVSISGTPDFMAPEIWAGKAPSRRSDVYSVGAVLFEMVAGRTPFADVAPANLPAVVQERDPPPLAEVAPAADPRFCAIVDVCLARDAAARYASGEELRETLEKLQRTASGVALPVGNPYRGLRAFDAAHRALFFGRNAEVGEILDRLRTEPFVLVTGDSGVGKSSICRAGVLPAVADGALAGGRVYTVATMVPGKRPLAALAAAVGDVDPARIAADPASLARDLYRRLGATSGLLLHIDQLEELLTLSDVGEAATVESALAHLAEGIPGVRILATLRADFLSRFAALPILGGDVARILYFLRPLPPERLREVIVGPAQATGTRFESDEMVTELVDATALAEGGLPLLQFALAELWEARDAARAVIPASALDAMGGVVGALARHADSVVAAMLPPQRALARRMLMRLVSSSGTRARRSETELAGDDRAAREVLDALVRGRLLVAYEADEGAAFELAHEVLIHGWGALRNWLAEDAHGRALHDRIAVAAAEWERIGRPPDALWGPRRLAEADAADPDALSPTERAFLLASGRAEWRRRWLRRGGVIGVVLLVLGVYGAFRFQSQQRLDGEVNVLLVAARGGLKIARDANRDCERLRLAAFGAFDKGMRGDGESKWAQALAAQANAEGAYGQASRDLEAAFAKDGGRDDVRALLADVLYERAVLAEAERRSDVRDELIQRLSVYDSDGSRTARWNARAEIEVTSQPAARVALDGERDLGATPVRTSLARGSHVLVLEAPGRATVRYPVLLSRGARRAIRVTLPPSERIPDGFTLVPAGTFVFGAGGDEDARRGFFDTAPAHEVDTGPYLIGQHEVTYEDWLAFVDSLPPDQRGQRIPRVATKVGQSGALLVEKTPRGWTLTLQPVDRPYRAAWGERVHYAGRQDHDQQDWRRLPVTGISAEDAEAYAEWLDRTGRVPGARLCTELEWERAARGADERIYPHGDDIQPGQANFDQTYGRELMGPDEVGSHPMSRSPFGLDDMSGNAFEWTTSSFVRGNYVGRGGSYFHDRKTIQVINRAVSSPAIRDATLGLRICASFTP